MEVICHRCSGAVGKDVFFCPSCGSAQLATLLTKTTANWDPTNPANKPWREATKPPPLPPHQQQQQQRPGEKKPSWKPPSKQGKQAQQQHQQQQQKGKGRRVAEGSLPQKDYDDPPSSSVVTFDTSVTDGKSRAPGGGGANDSRRHTPGVVYFKQLAFQRRGAKRMVASTMGLQQLLQQGGRPTEAAEEESKAGEEVVLVHPLAVYEATWIPSPGYTVHISLVDRSFANTDASRFFLRVGTVLERPNGAVDDLQVVEVLQNDAGKLLTPPLQYWIDLNVINVDEYYMSTFLQQSLRHIALRVRRPSRLTRMLVDQVCLVEAVHETASEHEGKEEEDEEEDGGGGQGGRGKRGRKGNLIAVISDQRLGVLLPPSSPPQGHEGAEATAAAAAATTTAAIAGAPDLALDKTIAQRAVRVPVGPLYNNENVMVTLRLSVQYPDAESLMLDPLPLKRDDIMARVPVKFVVLHMFPFYSERRIAPKVLSIEAKALVPLLAGEAEADVDAVLEEGPRAVAGLLAKIARLLYFRVDAAGGVRVAVTGAASLAANDAPASASASTQPNSGSPPPLHSPGQGAEHGDEDEEDEFSSAAALLAQQQARREELQRQRNEEEEARLLRDKVIEQRAKEHILRSGSCVTIQCLWRRALAKEMVRRLRLRNSKAVPIQSLARRIIARARVRQRAQAKAREELQKSVVAEAEKWVPSLLQDCCPAHGLPLCPCTRLRCNLQGTLVDLFCPFSFLSLSLSLSSSSSADGPSCVLTIIEAPGSAQPQAQPQPQAQAQQGMGRASEEQRDKDEGEGDGEDLMRCRVALDVGALEQLASSLVHAGGYDEAHARPASGPGSSPGLGPAGGAGGSAGAGEAEAGLVADPRDALLFMLETDSRRAHLLEAASQGLDLFVVRHMELFKATFDVAKCSTAYHVFADGDDLVVGI